MTPLDHSWPFAAYHDPLAGLESSQIGRPRQSGATSRSTFANGKASDSAIRAYLLTAKFLPDAAETVVRSYRDTKQLVESASGEYNAPSDKAVEPIKAATSQEGRQESSAAPIPAIRSQSGGVRLMEGERELTTGLLSKDASFRLIVSGSVGEKEIDRLIAKLTIDKEILAETPEHRTGAAQPEGGSP